MNLNDLIDKRSQLIDEQDVLVAKIEAEKRKLTTEERGRFDEITAELDTLATEIEDARRIEEVKRRKVQAKTPEQKLMDSFSFANGVRSLLAGKPLEGAEAEMHQEAEREASRAGTSVTSFGVPGWAVRWKEDKEDRSWVVGTPSAGGHTKQTEVQPIVDPLRPQSILSTMGITVRQGLQGDLKFPTDTASNGGWNTEVGTADEYTPSIGEVLSSPKRYAAYARLSKQLLQQSTSISEQYIRRQLELTIGTAIDKAGIHGGGANEPTGIIGNSGVKVLYAGLASGSGVNADGAALVWGDITSLYKEVMATNISMENLYYLTTPGVMEVGSRTPRQANGVEGNFIWNEALRAYGQQVNISTNVPSNLEKGSSGETLHALIFGNFGELALHQWGGLDIVIDPYTRAKNAQIEIVTNIWVDFCITRPQAFAVIKDIVA